MFYFCIWQKILKIWHFLTVVWLLLNISYNVIVSSCSVSKDSFWYLHLTWQERPVTCYKTNLAEPQESKVNHYSLYLVRWSVPCGLFLLRSKMIWLCQSRETHQWLVSQTHSPWSPVYSDTSTIPRWYVVKCSLWVWKWLSASGWEVILLFF